MSRPAVLLVASSAQFPLLSRVAFRVFSVTAASAEPERVFSGSGRIVTAERSTLTPQKVKKLVFLSHNARARDSDGERRAARWKLVQSAASI